MIGWRVEAGHKLITYIERSLDETKVGHLYIICKYH